MRKKGKNQLTDKQEKFVQEFLIDLNGKQAAIRAGYSEKTAENQASRLLSNDKVADRVSELKGKMAKKLEVTREMIVERLNKRSQLVQELQDLASKDKLTNDEQSKLIRLQMVIKTSDANKSDEILNKMLGFNEPDNSVVNHIWKADFGTDNKKD